jgi:bacterioferritin
MAPANDAKRSEILELLERAYWMEMETVMSYVANAAALDGIRAEEIAEALSADVDEELGHARRFADRIKELYGTPPGSLAFTAEQAYLQPPEDATVVGTVIRGVIEAEAGAIAHYNRIIEVTDGIDWATQDIVIEILRDEEGHLRQFERYLREFE